MRLFFAATILLFATGCGDRKELSESSAKYLGETLFVETSYGYGWERPDESVKAVPNFVFKLVSLWRYEGKLRGGVGLVETPNHPLDGSWLVFSTRHDALYDFDVNIGQYNLQFHVDQPELKDSGWPSSDRPPIASGYGQIRVLANEHES